MTIENTSWKGPHTVGFDLKRYSETLKRLPRSLTGQALDLGVPNPFTPYVKEKYPELTILNTPEDNDFDTDQLHKEDKVFDAIFHFQVIGHLMNPLWNLRECHRVLKDDGRLYMTTLKGPLPQFLIPGTYFYAADSSRLVEMISLAGFDVVRFERLSQGPLWWAKGTLHNRVRILFGGLWWFIELRKTNHD